jgi:AraC-like DNA-binding protein
MVAGLSYREFPPPADLARWVACFWQIQGAPAAGTSCSHRVLPDGCADLLFDLGAARQRGGTQGEVVGPMSRAFVVELRGPVDLLGVRFRAGAIGAFAGVPAQQLLDTAAVIGDLPAGLAVSVAELAEETTSAARVGLVASACRTRIEQLRAPDPVVAHALSRWAAAEQPDFPTVSILVRDIALSERAFQRRFIAQVGLTPVAFRRLARFRSVLRLFARGTRDWADLAAMTGFSDQSHLVRECRSFTGLSPAGWVAAQSGSAGFLQDGEITTL